jgi:uncharacterized membrane protein YedE/YeeE
METTFTPLTSLVGGMLIGLAAVLLMASNGRIAGISGILSRILPPKVDTAGWLPAAALVLGLLAAAPLYGLLASNPVEQTINTGIWPLAVAGLLVGFGAAFGNGCTSGHGVCGISRLSARSIVATVTFMITAAATVYIVRHLLGG